MLDEDIMMRILKIGLHSTAPDFDYVIISESGHIDDIIVGHFKLEFAKPRAGLDLHFRHRG